MQTKKKINFLFLFIILSSFVTAQTLPTRYWGDVTIDGYTAPSGTKIEVIIDDSIVTSTTTSTVGSYFVNILTQDNEDVVFQVWGINAETIKYDSDDSGEFIKLDLLVNKLANNQACVYNQACQSGQCCSGICKTSCSTDGGSTGGSGSSDSSGSSSSSSSSSSSATSTQPETTPQTTTAPLTNPFGDIMFGSDDGQDSTGTDDSNTDTQVNSADSDKETESGLEKTTGGVTFNEATGILSTPAAFAVVLGIGIVCALAYFYFRRN